MVVFQLALPMAILFLVGTLHARLGARQWEVLVSGESDQAVSALAEKLAQIPGVVVERDPEQGKAKPLRHAALIRTAGQDDLEEGPVVCGGSQIAVVARLLVGRSEQPLSCRKDSGGTGGDPRFLAGAVAMALSGMGLFGFGSRLASYRQRGLIRALALTPAGARGFLTLQASHRVLLMTAQAVLLVVVGRQALGIEGAASWPALVAVVAAGGIAFLALGFLVGGTVASGEVATGIGHLLNFPGLVLSGAFHPIATMPSALQAVSGVQPMTYLVRGMGRAIEGRGDVFVDVAILLGFAVLLAALGVWRFRFE